MSPLAFYRTWKRISWARRRRIFHNVQGLGLGLFPSLRLTLEAEPFPRLLKTFGVRMMQLCQEASDEAGVRPFIMWGTLLGYRRDGGFIKHDSDIDYCIFDHDLVHLKAFKTGLEQRGMRLEVYPQTPFLFRAFLVGLPELHIDYWVMHRQGQDYLTSMPEYLGRGHFHYRLPASGLDKFQTVDFLGCQVLAPCYIDALLTLAYAGWKKIDRRFHDYKMPCAELCDQPPEVKVWPHLSVLE